jgi:hypothetical protein
MHDPPSRAAYKKARRRVEAADRGYAEQRRRWLDGELDAEPEYPHWENGSLEMLATLEMQLAEFLGEVERHPDPRDDRAALQKLHGWRKRVRWEATFAPRRSTVQPSPRAAQRQARPRGRRTGASSRTSSCDPGGSDDPPRSRRRPAAPALAAVGS